MQVDEVVASRFGSPNAVVPVLVPLLPKKSFSLHRY